jgi:hypothetical protein
MERERDESGRFLTEEEAAVVRAARGPRVRLTLDPQRATTFRDASGRRHDRDSEWGLKCRKTF